MQDHRQSIDYESLEQRDERPWSEALKKRRDPVSFFICVVMFTLLGLLILFFVLLGLFGYAIRGFHPT